MIRSDVAQLCGNYSAKGHADNNIARKGGERGRETRKAWRGNDNRLGSNWRNEPT